MIIATHYTVERGEAPGTYKIRNMDAPICPDCGQLLSGYDTRARHVVDGSGSVYWFQLRRLQCLSCGKIHLELPDFMQVRKHYEAQLIRDVLAGRSDSCTPDDSTIRRWRREKSPPGSP